MSKKPEFWFIVAPQSLDSDRWVIHVARHGICYLQVDDSWLSCYGAMEAAHELRDEMGVDWRIEVVD